MVNGATKTSTLSADNNIDDDDDDDDDDNDDDDDDGDDDKKGVNDGDVIILFIHFLDCKF